ncbi:hypothetical protein D3C72_1594100 [compost metagenome]
MGRRDIAAPLILRNNVRWGARDVYASDQSAGGPVVHTDLARLVVGEENRQVLRPVYQRYRHLGSAKLRCSAPRAGDLGKIDGVDLEKLAEH